MLKRNGALRLRSEQWKRLRDYDAELKRRDHALVDRLRAKLDAMQKDHHKEEAELEAEWVRALRARPGTKYDIRTRSKKLTKSPKCATIETEHKKGNR